MTIATNSNSWNTNGNTATSPATNFLGTTDNQSLVMRTNALERVRIDSIGRVGINDATPRATLSLGAAQGSKIRLYDNNTDTLVYGFGISNSSLNYIIENNDLAAHRFWSGGDNDNGTELMHIQGNGNVGIATAFPQQTLHVQGTARVTGSSGTPTTIAGRNAAGDMGNVAIGTGLSLTSGTLSATIATPGWGLTGNAGTSSANFLGTTDAQPLVFATAAAERLRISAAGNVGIGNPAPVSPLSFGPILGNKIAFYDGGAGQYLGIGVSASQLNYHVGTNSAHVFFAGGINGNGTELMRIQNSGNVGINNAAPLSPLSFASATGAKISLYDAGSTTEHYGLGVSGGQLNYQVMAGGAHTFRIGGKNEDGTELMRISPTGNVGVGTSTPTSMLDVAGTVRIQGSAGTPTAITGRDAFGNINNITLGANLSLAGGVLSASGGGTAGWGLTGNSGTTLPLILWVPPTLSHL
jgi:hypothetical protein